MSKRAIVLVSVLLGALGFIVSIGSPDWYHGDSDTIPKSNDIPDLRNGVYRYCNNYPDDCHTIQSADLNACARGNYDSNDAYLVLYGSDNCKKHITTQVFSMIALVLSIISSLIFLLLKSRSKTASIISLLSSISAIIGLIVFVNIEPFQIYKNIPIINVDSDKTLSQLINDKIYVWGWGFGFYIIGIIGSVIAAILGLIFAKDLTGGYFNI